MALRELAAAWVRANCPRPDVQANFLNHLDHAVQRGANCSFMIGRELTKSDKPFLVYCFRDELFAFELTPSESTGLNVTDNMLVCAESHRVNEPRLTVEPIVWLDDVEVDNAEGLDRLQPITGTARYRTEQFVAEPLAIQAVCEPPGRPCTTLSHHVFCLTPPEGAIRFSLPALGDLRDSDGVQFAGVVPFFFQLWAAPEHESQPTVPFPSPAPLPASWPTTRPSAMLPNPTVLKPALPSFAATPKPVMPAMSPYPPTYDPGSPIASSARVEGPISDIRAVLVEIIYPP